MDPNRFLADLERLGIHRFDDESVLTDVGLRPFAPVVASLGIYTARSLGPRGELSFATSAGGGIDLRRIPAA